VKFCFRGRVREVVIYFKFHENRSKGLGAVGGRKSPSPIDLAHGLYNSLYYRTSRDGIAKLAVQYKQRPNPKDWKQITETEVYKNDNTLRDYQLEGLNWLTFSYYNRYGVSAIV